MNVNKQEPEVHSDGQGDNNSHPSKLGRVLGSVWHIFGGHAAVNGATSQQSAERKTRTWLGNLTGFGRVGASSSGTVIHYRPPTCVR
ncbi:uncharacterized protein LOC144914365 isoform X3 [Branchiostoma floridae x Branchiostoma belcheri]